MTGMEHVVREVAFALGTYHQDEAAYLVPQARVVVQHLAEKGLIAPAPLREDQRSEHTVRETAAYFARKVQRIGDRISDRDYRRSLVDVLALENVQGFLDRIARDDLDVYATDAVNRAEGDGRADRPSWVDEHGINHADGDGGRW